METLRYAYRPSRLIGILMAVARLRFDHRLLVDSLGVELPRRAWSHAHERIAFADITDMKVRTAKRNHLATFKHKSGNFVIDANRLPSRADFDKVVRAIADRAAARHQA